MIPTTVEDLKARWTSLHELDRAESIRLIHENGHSLRSIARDVGCCAETTIRNLFYASKAPLSDRRLVRRGEISLRELARRSKIASQAKAEKIKASEEKLRAKEASLWSTEVCRWLQEQNLAWAHQEQIIEETRREMFEADLARTVPNSEVPRGMALNVIIELTRPSETGWSFWIYMYISWLAHWTLAAIPDRIVQDAALADALKRTRQQEVVHPRKTRAGGNDCAASSASGQ